MQFTSQISKYMACASRALNFFQLTFQISNIKFTKEMKMISVTVSSIVQHRDTEIAHFLKDVFPCRKIIRNENCQKGSNISS